MEQLDRSTSKVEERYQEESLADRRMRETHKRNFGHLTESTYVTVPKRLVEHLPELTGRALKVYVAIREHEDYREGTRGNCWPKIATIAKMIGMSPSTVKRGLAELKGLNHPIISVERSRYPDGKLGFNFYKFPDRNDHQFDEEIRRAEKTSRS